MCIDYANTLSPRTKALVLAGVMMGLFLAALDQTIVTTALPRIVSELQGMELLAGIAFGAACCAGHGPAGVAGRVPPCP